MHDSNRDNESSAAAQAADSATSLALPPGAPALPATDPDESKPANELSPEEQMALYEKELKESDWGHQPC